MTSARRPAGTPAGWQDRQPAGAPPEEEQVEQGGPETAARIAQNPPQEVDDAPNEAESEAEAVETDFDALLKDVQRERDEYLSLAQRAKADFENYRKRAAQQAGDAERKAKSSLARDLIPAIDNLERALETAPADDPLADGVRLVHRELTEALARAGVTPFDPTGEKFDPTSSEALSSRAADGADSGSVVETLARGYRLDDQVIRPARVVVAE